MLPLLLAATVLYFALAWLVSPRRLSVQAQAPIDTFEGQTLDNVRQARPYQISEAEGGEFRAVTLFSVRISGPGGWLVKLAEWGLEYEISLATETALPPLFEAKLGRYRHDDLACGIGQSLAHAARRKLPLVISLAGPALSVVESARLVLAVRLVRSDSVFSFLFPFPKLVALREIALFLGPPLGEWWTGIDLATAGGSIAASNGGDIFLEKDEEWQEPAASATTGQGETLPDPERIRRLTEPFFAFMRRGKGGPDFQPRRCVVAVSSLLTVAQRRAVWEAVKTGGNFAEVRCITEAEAVFCHHWQRGQEAGPGASAASRPRCVLVVDMGRSTLQATVLLFQPEKERGELRYRLEILASLGYALGLETADEAILRAVAKALRADFGGRFAPFDPFQTEKSPLPPAWKEVAAQCRLRLKPGLPRLTAAEAFAMVKDRIFPEDQTMKGAGRALADALADALSSGSYALLWDAELKSRVFRPVDQMVRDAVALAGSPPVQIIGAGPGMEFPGIADTIQDAVRKSGADPKIEILSSSELKSAVARGCCWFGAHRNAIRVEAPRLTATLGFRQKASLHDLPRFVPVLLAGTPWGAGGPGRRAAGHTVSVSAPRDFKFDNHAVLFYRVMTAGPGRVFARGREHQATELARVKISGKVREIRMETDQAGALACAILYADGRADRHEFPA